MPNKSKHAFGNSADIQGALNREAINTFDILFLDGNTNEPKIGWIDGNGNPVIVGDKKGTVRVDVLPTANGEEDVVYIYNNEGYIWSAAEGKCVPLSKPANVSALESEVSVIKGQLDGKVDAATVETLVETLVKDYSEQVGGGEVVEF